MKYIKKFFIVVYSLWLMALCQQTQAAKLSVNPADFYGDFRMSATVDLSPCTLGKETHTPDWGVFFTCLGADAKVMKFSLSENVSQAELEKHLPNGAKFLSYEIVRRQVNGKSGNDIQLPVEGMPLSEGFKEVQFEIFYEVRVIYQAPGLDGIPVAQNLYLYSQANVWASAYRPLYIQEKGSNGSLLAVTLRSYRLGSGDIESVAASGIRVKVSMNAPGRTVWPPEAYTNDDGTVFFDIFVEPEAYDSVATARHMTLHDLYAENFQETSEATLTLDVEQEYAEIPVPLPKYFATAQNVQGSVYAIDPLSGAPSRIKPNDGFVIGTRIYGEIQENANNKVYPAITLSFANGDYLESLPLIDNLSQPILFEIGPEGSKTLGRKKSAFEIGLQNLHYQATQEPRQLLGYFLTKAAKAAAATFTGGYNFLIKKAATKTVEYGMQKLSDYQTKGVRQSLSASEPEFRNAAATTGTFFVSNPGIKVWVDVLENGTMEFTNAGESLVLISETDGTRIIAGGATTKVDVYTTNFTATTPIPIPITEAGQGNRVILTPSEGARLNTRTPNITVDHRTYGSDLIRAEGATFWVNGINVSDRLYGDWFLHSYTVPLEARLKEGENIVEVLLRTDGGGLFRRTARFQATGKPTAPSGLIAFSGSTALSVRWKPNQERDIDHYQVFKSSDPNQIGYYLGSTQQTLWMDSTPPNGATIFYRVIAVDSANQQSEPSEPVSAALTPHTPMMPENLGAIGFEVHEGKAIVTIAAFGAATVGCLIERSTSIEGPFESLLSAGAILGQYRYIDATAQPGISYYYRIIPVGLNGVPGQPTLAGPFTLPDSAPPPPTGLAFDIQADRIIIRWNPTNYPHVRGYRLYRWTEAQGWQSLNPSQPLTDTSYIEELEAARSVRLYAVAAVDTSNREGEASQALSLSLLANVVPEDPNSQLVWSGDYNGDGKADLIWLNSTTGQAYGMLLNGTAINQQGMFYAEPNTAWRIVHQGDFDGNGQDDLLWWNSQTGQVYRMPMNGLNITGGTMLYQEPNTAWQIAAVGDLNGDNRDDLVWWNNQTGQVYGMLMNGDSRLQEGMLYVEPNTAWQIVAARDITGDGKADLLWRNQNTGQVYLLSMNGLSITGGWLIYHEPDLKWSIVAVGDLDGDGKTDIIWWNSQTGQVYGMLMNGPVISAQGMMYVEPNTAWRIVASADYTGDGRADLLWRNSTTGQVYEMLMSGLSLIGGAVIYTEANADWRIVAGTAAPSLPPPVRLLRGASLSGELLNKVAPPDGVPVNDHKPMTGVPINPVAPLP